jgi:hypothetical protein
MDCIPSTRIVRINNQLMNSYLSLRQWQDSSDAVISIAGVLFHVGGGVPACFTATGDECRGLVPVSAYFAGSDTTNHTTLPGHKRSTNAFQEPLSVYFS